MSEEQNEFVSGMCVTKEELDLLKTANSETFERYMKVYEKKMQEHTNQILAIEKMNVALQERLTQTETERVKFEAEQKNKMYQLEFERSKLELEHSKLELERAKFESQQKLKTLEESHEFWLQLIKFGISCAVDKLIKNPNQLDPEIQKQIDVSNSDLSQSAETATA